MQPRALINLGLLLLLGCATRVPEDRTHGAATLPQLATEASARFHLTVANVRLAPHGQLQVDLGDSVSQQLTDSAMRDTVTAIARWTWTEAEKQQPVVSLVVCCLASADQPVTRVFPNRQALFDTAEH